VGHPAVVVTVVLAWLGVLAVCVAAFLFGQTARTAPRGGRRRSRAGRTGLFLSLSGPWLALLLGGAGGALTGEWLTAAAAAAAAAVAISAIGLTLAPH
jgi:hypothetical protein